MPDFLKMVATNAIPAEHLENPTAYILQLTVTDGKFQKADIQRKTNLYGIYVAQAKFTLNCNLICALLNMQLCSRLNQHQKCSDMFNSKISR